MVWRQLLARFADGQYHRLGAGQIGGSTRRSSAAMVGLLAERNGGGNLSWRCRDGALSRFRKLRGQTLLTTWRGPKLILFLSHTSHITKSYCPLGRKGPRVRTIERAHSSRARFTSFPFGKQGGGSPKQVSHRQGMGRRPGWRAPTAAGAHSRASASRCGTQPGSSGRTASPPGRPSTPG